MSAKRRDPDDEAENSGQAFQKDVDDLYGVPEDNTESEGDKEKDKEEDQ